MYAIVKCGGKQIKVAKGDTLSVEKLNAEAGTTVKLEEVLLTSDGKKVTVGTPTVKGAVVEAKVVEHSKADKIIVFKKKRRQNYRRKQGHRQHQTVIEITGIKA